MKIEEIELKQSYMSERSLQISQFSMGSMVWPMQVAVVVGADPVAVMPEVIVAVCEPMYNVEDDVL